MGVGVSFAVVVIFRWERLVFAIVGEWGLLLRVVDASAKGIETGESERCGQGYEMIIGGLWEEEIWVDCEMGLGRCISPK